MYQQTGLLLYKFRFLFAGILIIAFLMATSAVVTAIGSGTVLAHPSSYTPSVGVSSGPNVVTAGASAFEGNIQRAMVSTAADMYGACRSVTALSAKSGRSISHGSADMIGGAWGGTTFVARGAGHITMATLHATGTATMFTVRLPGKAVGSLANGSGHTVSSIIQPSGEVDSSVPIINDQTSTAILAHLSAEQQQEIAKLQAAQVVANQALDGTIVAGDPDHGGYPAKWDDIAQDSAVDSWGMYNRECVSYAAWKVYQAYGDMPNWGGVGNANEWVRDAVRAGIPTSSTPKVGSVAISMRGYYGHAMWVEKVSGDLIYVSQYNYDLHGHYSEMWLKSSDLTYIYFH